MQPKKRMAVPNPMGIISHTLGTNLIRMSLITPAVHAWGGGSGCVGSAFEKTSTYRQYGLILPI